ncbi:hypothetical protein NYE55_39505 [Bacillus sp. FSL R12-0069]|uniref:hypothetical protein n=1 Tax=Bacillus sp. FSL R12-0069 TaxID=2975342 RepID=UPI0030FCEC9B
MNHFHNKPNFPCAFPPFSSGVTGPTGATGSFVGGVTFDPGNPSGYLEGEIIFYNGSTYVVNTNNPTGIPGQSPDYTLVSAAGATGPTGPQGAQGIQGPTGPQGIQGPTGPQGIQGPTGPQGIQGPTGPQGIQGPTGPQGIQGPTGPQGIQGPTGPQGIQGPTGPQGIQGPTGPQGIQGPTGPQGIQGPTGPQGIQGPTGPQGIQGPTGPQGIQGPTGPQGIQGPTGITGPTGGIDIAYAQFAGENVIDQPASFLRPNNLTLLVPAQAPPSISFIPPTDIILAPNQVFQVSFGGNVIFNGTQNQSTCTIGYTLDGVNQNGRSFTFTIQGQLFDPSGVYIIETNNQPVIFNLITITGGAGPVSFSQLYLSIIRIT